MKYKINKDEKGYINEVNNIKIKNEVNLKNSKDKFYILSFRENEDNSLSVWGMFKKDWIVINFNEIEEII
jgi:hypothetical protein